MERAPHTKLHRIKYEDPDDPEGDLSLEELLTHLSTGELRELPRILKCRACFNEENPHQLPFGLSGFTGIEDHEMADWIEELSNEMVKELLRQFPYCIYLLRHADVSWDIV